MAAGLQHAHVREQISAGAVHLHAAHLQCRASAAVARAPVKPVPRIKTRTGLIEWPTHQLGGSTLVTVGGAAASTQHGERKQEREQAFHADAGATERPCRAGAPASCTRCISSAAMTRNTPPATTA